MQIGDRAMPTAALPRALKPMKSILVRKGEAHLPISLDASGRFDVRKARRPAGCSQGRTTSQSNYRAQSYLKRIIRDEQSLQMRVREIMGPLVQAVSSEHSLRDRLLRVASCQIQYLPVVGIARPIEILPIGAPVTWIDKTTPFISETGRADHVWPGRADDLVEKNRTKICKIAANQRFR